jgi:hypothetical protein
VFAQNIKYLSPFLGRKILHYCNYAFFFRFVSSLELEFVRFNNYIWCRQISDTRMGSIFFFLIAKTSF